MVGDGRSAAPPPPLPPWLVGAVRAARTSGPVGTRARVLAGVALAVADQRGIALPDLPLLSRWGAPVALAVPSEHAVPDVLGRVHQVLLERSARRRSGVFYTPASMADTAVAWGFGAVAAPHPVVCDPAVGGGAFLLAAADALAGRGVPRREVVERHVVGVDVDPVAAAVAEASLSLWADGAVPAGIGVGDALVRPVSSWPDHVDVVVGNPPFLNQLSRETARSAASAAALRERFGRAALGYVDAAALFLLLATRLVADRGAVAMVLPRSFVATRHAAGVRREVLEGAALDTLWFPDDDAFDASVQTCVVVLRKGGPRRSRVRRLDGTPPQPQGEVAVDQDHLATSATWSSVALARADALPDAELHVGGALGEWCRVAADFRDQYYGVAPFVVDDPDHALDDVDFPRLVTSGLIDPAVCAWGRRRVRYHRRDWAAPRVDLAGLVAGTRLGPWSAERLVPKIVLATQTRVLEAVADERGVWLPSTPVVSVVPPPDRLWHAAAVLSAPPVTAWAVRHHGGAALSADAIKLSAGQVRTLPTPGDAAAWDQAAALVREASAADDHDERRRCLLAAGAASCKAYGVVGDDVLEWWAGRLPVPR